MFKKIKKFINNNIVYKPYNMIICKNDLHKGMCDCECHTYNGMLHIIDCCHQEKCPDCKKELNIKKRF